MNDATGALAQTDKDGRRNVHALLALPRGISTDVTWNVTQEDIDAGERVDCWKCPVALSLEREFPELLPEVDPVEITLYEKTEDATEDRPAVKGHPVAKARTPGPAQRFIADFDEDKDVEPFSLTVTFTRL